MFMRRGFPFLFFLVFAIVTSSAREEQPVSAIHYPEYAQLTLDNGTMKVHIYLPDAETGYYRGTRFDWSGVIRRVEYNGHTFYGEWKTTHDPSNHDDIPGPVDEFGMFSPLGFQEAQPGEAFVKIGVGSLRKPDSQNYSPFRKYPIVKAGEWTVEHEDDWVSFQQDFEGPEGWAYEYTKKIELDGNEFMITRTLKNKGSKAIETEQYNHNFTVIDDMPIGPAYQIQFNFNVNPEQNMKGYALAEGKEINFIKSLTADNFFTELKGHEVLSAPLEFSIHNREKNAWVHITERTPLQRLNFWSTTWATCPEPFIPIELDPGEEMRWFSQYAFQTMNSVNEN